jgi:AcrR family transcriptional regulator
MSRRMKLLEAQLTPQQIKAAELMAENEWAGIIEGIDKKTMEQIAAEVAVSRRTLYVWTSKREFGDYLNELSDAQYSAMRRTANAAVMKLIKAANPSVKALDLYYRRHALLTDRSIVEDAKDEAERKRKTDDEVRQEIADLDALVNGKEA